MVEFVYIGFSERMLRHMIDSPRMKLVGVITVENKISQEVQSLLHGKGIPVAFCRNKGDVYEAAAQWGDILYVMYSFGIILSEEMVEKYTIINVHPGDLDVNRGRNPVSWSILDGDSHITLSLHKVSKEIDMGYLLSKLLIPVAQEDDYRSLNDKIGDAWGQIEEVLIQFVGGKIPLQKVRDGIYRRAITQEDYTIRMPQDTEQEVIQKIKSQAGFSGAIIRYKNLILRVTSWEEVLEEKKDFA